MTTESMGSAMEIDAIASTPVTPADVVQSLNAAVNAALAEPAMTTRLAEMGGMVLAGSPADFGRLIAEETEKWAQVVQFSGAKQE
jgi:tripartite-type tricarboxylate transporter receptor subunit TctC